VVSVERLAGLLAPVSAIVLGFWLIATVVSIDHGWADELWGNAGDSTNVSGEWLARGTLFSPPLAALVVQAGLTALALLRARIWRLVAGIGLALLGCLYVVIGLGEPVDPVASDPRVVAHVLLRIVGLAGAVALVVVGAAAAIQARRGS
jgi:hypothetical protein